VSWAPPAPRPDSKPTFFNDRQPTVVGRYST
jgi:hypothetical protein